MKKNSMFYLVLSAVVIYAYTSRSSYQRIDFIPPVAMINNHGMWYERTKIRTVVQSEVDNKNFAQLADMVQQARTQNLQFNTMTSVLYDLYNGIPYSMPDFPTIHAFINQWRSYDVKSNIPDILEARAYVAKAWEIRGNGYKSYVSEDQFSGFADYLAKAWEAIERAEAKGPVDAELCALQTELSFTLFNDKALGRRYFEQCKVLWPGYIHLYYRMRTYLQPIWFGSDTELIRFIEQSADETQAIYGDGLYALLVASHTFNTRKIFAVNGGPYSWQRVKAGFNDVFKQYGKSRYILHAFGYCAMLAEDHLTLAEILQEIGTQWDEEKERYFKKKGWYDYHLSQAQIYIEQ